MDHQSNITHTRQAAQEFVIKVQQITRVSSASLRKFLFYKSSDKSCFFLFIILLTYVFKFFILGSFYIAQELDFIWVFFLNYLLLLLQK